MGIKQLVHYYSIKFDDVLIYEKHIFVQQFLIIYNIYTIFQSIRWFYNKMIKNYDFDVIT